MSECNGLEIFRGAFPSIICDVVEWSDGDPKEYAASEVVCDSANSAVEIFEEFIDVWVLDGREVFIDNDRDGVKRCCEWDVAEWIGREVLTVGKGAGVEPEVILRAWAWAWEL